MSVWAVVFIPGVTLSAMRRFAREPASHRWSKSNVNTFLILIILVVAVTAAVFAVEWLRERRHDAAAFAADDDATAFPLPERYRHGAAISSAPMPGAADLVFDRDGAVAWDQVWGDFCDLAIAGGPPHRDTLLHPASADQIAGLEVPYERVRDELERGMRLITGWPVERNLAAGWIGLRCPDDDAAYWMLHAVAAENVAAGRVGSLLLLPAGPDFRLKYEIKNVITAVAKTHHYWTEHIAEQERLLVRRGARR